MRLTLGKHMIQNILDPRPEEIDLEAIDARLRIMHRFSNDPRSLTVHQHRHLVSKMAFYHGAPPSIVDWCLHHDDHEAAIGDIPGPLKKLISQETDILIRIEDRLDRAICSARGVPFPDLEVRQQTHLYDKAAETVEWVHHMGQPRADWNAKTPPGMSEDHLKRVLWEARQIK